MRITFAFLTAVGIILIGQSEPNFITDSPTEKCYQNMVDKGIIKTCKNKAIKDHPFTNPPLDQMTNKPVADHRYITCDSDIQMVECVNDNACNICSADDASAFGINWYDQRVDNFKVLGCKKTPKAKCQPPVTTVNPKAQTSHTKMTRSTATLITIIVVVFIFLIVGAIVVYCLFFSSSGAEDKKIGGKPKSSKGGPKTCKVAEASAKSKSVSGAIKSIAKSTVKSGISAGGKSKMKSTISGGGKSKVKSTLSGKSKVKSSVAEFKAGAKAKS